MNYDISILIPAIRTNRWTTLYDSIQLACKNYKWQLVLVSPFELPENLRQHKNIKLVQDYGSVSRAVQIGMSCLDSDTVFVTVDDCTFAEDSIDTSLEQYKKECSKKDVLAIRYSEGGQISNKDYYVAGYHDALKLPNINPDWKIAPQFIMDKNYFIELGGFDCRYEYMNEPVHDFMFRLQTLKNKVIISNVYCCIASHYPGLEGDHAPIHNAQSLHDYPLFRHIYANNLNTIHIDYNNWQNSPNIWERRFPEKYSSYEELVKKQGYQI